MVGDRHRRLPHIDVGGAAYFLTFRLHPSQPHLDPTERNMVMEHLRLMSPGDLMSFVVMPDHVHVLYLVAPGGKLSLILQALKGSSSHRLVRTSQRVAPIWQRDTFDRVVRGEHELIETMRYIEANPVRKGLCASAEEYAWSSAFGRS
jgi:REP element-mobilizing transposase RayT